MIKGNYCSSKSVKLKSSMHGSHIKIRAAENIDTSSLLAFCCFGLFLASWLHSILVIIIDDEAIKRAIVIVIFAHLAPLFVAGGCRFTLLLSLRFAFFGWCS